jgi:nicotinate dehydrogenase subunit B
MHMKQDHKSIFMNDPSKENIDYNRRDFLKKMGLLGGGIIIYCTIGNTGRSSAQPGSATSPDFNAFLRIGADERVTCFIGKVDMGQGTITSFPQIVAEELDVAYDKVDMIMGDTDTCPWDIGTGGSMAIRVVGVQIRSAAAEAKGVLKLLAAEHLKCPVERLATKDGIVFDRKKHDKNVTYGTLTKGKLIEKHLETKPSVTSPTGFEFIGKPYFHKDAHKKVTGKAQYAGDIRLPEMLYAGILRPPVHGALLKSTDLTEAKKIEGVQIIEDNDFIAVLHETPDIARMALGMVKAEYDLPSAGLNNRNIYEHLLKVPVQAQVKEKKGDIEEGVNSAKEVFEETYTSAYVAHAPIETHTSIANIENGKVTIWASTQSPFAVQRTVAEGLKLPADKVRVITPFVGGAFGGKLTMVTDSNLEALEATRLAQLTGRPVQVSFSRAEEFFYDTFRPASIVKIKSGIDGSGRIVFWDYNVYMAGDRCAEVIYDIPHNRVNIYGTWMMPQHGSHPFRVGPWRAPGGPNNIHAKEMQISLMAAKAGVDPLEFRLKNMKDEKMIGVLKAAAKKFGYKPSKPVSGRGFGISCGIDAETYVAHIGEIEVDKTTGEIRVKRVVCVYDMGLCVNPQGTKIQMEGSCIMSMGYALTEGIRFSGGAILDKNFDTYKIPRFSWVPKIETLILKKDNDSPHGAGEPAVIGMGAVIATGLFDATGAKLFEMPMTPERVKAALAKV